MAAVAASASTVVSEPVVVSAPGPGSVLAAVPGAGSVQVPVVPAPVLVSALPSISTSTTISTAAAAAATVSTAPASAPGLDCWSKFEVISSNNGALDQGGRPSETPSQIGSLGRMVVELR